MAKYTWKMIFEDFKKTYPNKCRRGICYRPENFMTITVYIPEDGIYKYDYLEKKLTLVERYLTKNQTKYLKEFEREEKMRDISKIMTEKNISQRKLASMSGVSRQSINYYVTGNKIPKESTLNKLHNTLKENGYI